MSHCCKLFFIVFVVTLLSNLNAQQLESGFESELVLSGMLDPASFEFAPDGRLFYGERISGKLRVARIDTATGLYIINDTAFYEFDVPPEQHRSSGLRGFAFDPNFDSTGYIYAFYMKDNPRHNRLVRIQADPGNPDVSLPGETLYLEVPFNNTSSSGSHNGGDVMIGADNKLYFTTGDGWNGGDNVQSLSTYTGKVWRLNLDGSIPADNPFYNQAAGDFRAVFALGLRNPYSFSNLSPTDTIYINDAVGADKASVFRLNAGYNYGHDGYSGIGSDADKWANMSVNNAKVITGGAWYPGSGYWPEAYKENYFAAFWGSNASGSPGHITRAPSEFEPNPVIFYDDIIVGGELKPVMLKVGLDENLYYCMTDYTTGDGEIYKISYTGVMQVETPVFGPSPGQYDDPIQVSINSADSTSVYFTTDGSEPDSTSQLYMDSIQVDSSIQIKAIAYKSGFIPSLVATGDYTIGPLPNLPPVADAGPNLFVGVDALVTLNGAGTYDPDGNPLELQESWSQVAGDSVIIADSDETIANFTPTQNGYYAFQIKAEDIYGAVDSDEVMVQVVPGLDDYLNCLVARWSFEEGTGSTVEDSSPNNYEGTVENVIYTTNTTDSSDFSLSFTSPADRVAMGNIDIYSSEVTFTFWAYLNSYEVSDARFISKAEGQFDQDHFWMVSTLNDTRLRFRLKTSDGGTSTLISDLGVIPLNEWFHVAAVYDGSEMKLFKNAFEVTTMAKSGVLMTDPFVDAAIGNQPSSATGGTRHLDGNIDEMRIYGCALDSSQISQVFLSTYATYCYDTLQIPDVVDGVDLYEASNAIQSSAIIDNGANIIFSAKESIEFIYPFSVNLGANLKVSNDGCD